MQLQVTSNKAIVMRKLRVSGLAEWKDTVCAYRQKDSKTFETEKSTT